MKKILFLIVILLLVSFYSSIKLRYFTNYRIEPENCNASALIIMNNAEAYSQGYESFIKDSQKAVEQIQKEQLAYKYNISNSPVDFTISIICPLILFVVFPFLPINIVYKIISVTAFFPFLYNVYFHYDLYSKRQDFNLALLCVHSNYPDSRNSDFQDLEFFQNYGRILNDISLSSQANPKQKTSCRIFLETEIALSKAKACKYQGIENGSLFDCFQSIVEGANPIASYPQIEEQTDHYIENSKRCKK